MTTSDPTRSPPGTESMWAYTHVPQGQSLNAGSDALTGTWTQAEMSASLIAWNNELNAMRPGFVNESSSDTSWARGELQSRNANLVGGDINGGTAQLHQQLIFRPARGLGSAETPIGDLYLASSSAHPGGGVHGACGPNAASAVLAHHPILHLRRRQAQMPPGK